MKTPALDYCLKIFGHWNDPDGKIRNEMLKGPDTFIKDFVEPFRRELNQKLLNKAKPYKKKDLVKYYVHELNKTAKIIESYLSLDFIDVHDEDSKLLCRVSMSSESVIQIRFFEMICLLYRLIFNEIQDSSILHDIDFFEICKEVGFPLNTIDTTITEEYQKKRVPTLMKNSPVTEVQPKTKNKPGKTAQPEIIANPGTTNRTAMKPIKSLKFRDDLTENGFYTLKKVKDLNTAAIDKLTGFLFSNDLPYQIAMLDHLGFIEHIEKEYCTGRKDLYRILAGLLSSSGRLIQGNINVLINSSREDRDRFTSYNYKETVIKDYQELI